MKTLYLARHAKSSHKDPSIEDIDRPLNRRGKQDAPRIGAYLAERGEHPELILTSPARRTRATAKRFAAALGIDSECIVVQHSLYTFGDGHGVVGAIAAVDDRVQRLLIVGHNPTVTTLANRFTQHGFDEVPTSAVISVAFEIDSWRQIETARGRVAFFVWPRILPTRVQP
jgi:phosphohistidine phosphatase